MAGIIVHEVDGHDFTPLALADGLDGVTLDREYSDPESNRIPSEEQSIEETVTNIKDGSNRQSFPWLQLLVALSSPVDTASPLLNDFIFRNSICV